MNLQRLGLEYITQNLFLDEKYLRESPGITQLEDHREMQSAKETDKATLGGRR